MLWLQFDITFNPCITKCKVRRVRNGYTMEDIACLFACCAEYLCHCHPSKKTMFTSVEANKEAVKFMLTFVAATVMAIDFVPNTHAGLDLPS